jgi:hypothetical protein
VAGESRAPQSPLLRRSVSSHKFCILLRDSVCAPKRWPASSRLYYYEINLRAVLLFAVILCCCCWYFVSSCNQVGVFVFKMYSDVRDGPNQSRTSRCRCSPPQQCGQMCMEHRPNADWLGKTDGLGFGRHHPSVAICRPSVPLS